MAPFVQVFKSKGRPSGRTRGFRVGRYANYFICRYTEKVLPP
jgi:hypothetical protein